MSFKAADMYVYIPQLLHICVNDDQGERDEQVEEKPNINHLQIGSLWKAVVHLNLQNVNLNLTLP